jgi:hypothetical protein
MARKTMVALKAQADASIPDNATHQITAAAVRTLFKDFMDTMTPGFGAVGRATQTLINLGAVQQVVTYDTLLAVTVDFTANLALGTMQRLALGLPTVNTRVTFFAQIDCPAGSEINFTLFRDGVSVPGGCTVSGQGAGNPVEGSFTIINATPVAGDPVYKVMASKISGAASNVILTEARLILEVVPTIGP